MLNQIYSKSNFVKKETEFNFDINNVKNMSFKKDELFFVKDGDLKKEKENIIESKNVFTTYSNDSYNLYKNISVLLDDACLLYNLNRNLQKYMIYGKISEYNQDNKNIWYDFPGINIPNLHGFFFFNNNYKVSFKNQNSITEIDIKSNTIIINKPTDLIKINSENNSEVIEFYIFPNIMLKHNEPGVWIPV